MTACGHVLAGAYAINAMVFQSSPPLDSYDVLAICPGTDRVLQVIFLLSGIFFCYHTRDFVIGGM